MSRNTGPILGMFVLVEYISQADPNMAMINRMSRIYDESLEKFWTVAYTWPLHREGW